MSAPQAGATVSKSAAFGWFDFGFCAALLLFGLGYLGDARHWAANVYVGGAQYGDAQFWWDGALHFSQGIVADNPNLLYRMGYAAFGGAIAAVLGPDYLLFHKCLLVVFLAVATGLYAQLLGAIGRIAAVVAVLLLVFNPFTAEWLAISSSDGLGMILNLAAMLALGQGVRGALRLRWIALGGALLAGASLTRPLMTPMIVPALLAVGSAAGWRWRPASRAGAVLIAPFLGLTFAWMGLMAVLTGHFTVSGVNQESSIFYAASDPQIQVWRPDIIPPVEAAASRRMAPAPRTAAAVDREFWRRIRENYRRYRPYHLARLGRHLVATAAFTPRLATQANAASAAQRRAALLGLTALLVAAAGWRRRWLRAAAAAGLGIAWVFWPPFQMLGVLTAGSLGLFALLRGRRVTFLWASYWWIGAVALYFIGGTWGPPLGPRQELNALGYRLGFQVFFAADLLMIGSLAWVAGMPAASARRTAPAAARAARRLGLALASALLLILLAGVATVSWRGLARLRTTRVPYPDLAALARAWPDLPIAPSRDPLAPTRDRMALKAINGASGGRLLTTAMSTGFIWNLTGQQRCMLLLYLQDDLKPVRMAPYWMLAEISRQLPERAWMSRQGAWLVRPFPDLPSASNLPYYTEVPAIQAFIPLASDGRTYDLAGATVFPLSKYATQLSASGELAFRGATAQWTTESGGEKYPRRFALRSIGPHPDTLGWDLDLRRSRGHRRLRFGWRLESAAEHPPALPPAEFELTGGAGARLWDLTSRGGIKPLAWAEIPLGDISGARFTARKLLPGDTLWLYELTLTADDFAE